ncbi:hypothetical protein RFI_17949, partial [Reticulomyxa filosa]
MYKLSSSPTKTWLKGQSIEKLEHMISSKNLIKPKTSSKKALLKVLFDHFGLENDQTIEAREVRLFTAYFEGLHKAVFRVNNDFTLFFFFFFFFFLKYMTQHKNADQDTMLVLSMLLDSPKPLELRFDSEMNDLNKDMFIKRLCDYCCKHEREIKDIKPDFYAKNYLKYELETIKE